MKLPILFVVACLTIVVASSSIIAFNPYAFAKGDKCISIQDAKSDGGVINCDADKKNPELSSDAKRECRENRDTGDKCSSSQTLHGELGNFFKENK
jgi:hypothetical protein